MREIKFRTFIGGRFSYWGFMKGTAGLYFAAVGSTTSELLTFEKIQERTQQYTGLHDKNGKEIYEGDIIQFDKNYWNRKAEVVWSCELGLAGWSLKDTNCLLSKNHIKQYGEVIGNIYEHPNLIK